MRVLEALEQEMVAQDHFNRNFDYALELVDHPDMCDMPGEVYEEVDMSVVVCFNDVCVVVDGDTYTVCKGAQDRVFTDVEAARRAVLEAK